MSVMRMGRPKAQCAGELFVVLVQSDACDRLEDQVQLDVEHVDDPIRVSPFASFSLNVKYRGKKLLHFNNL